MLIIVPEPALKTLLMKARFPLLNHIVCKMAEENYILAHPVSLFLLVLVFMVSPGETYIVVCYVDAASVTRPGYGRLVVKNIQASLCTDIIFAYVNINLNNLSLRNNHERDNNTQAELLQLRNRNPNVRLLVALGGEQVQSSSFERIAKDEADTIVFSNNVARQLRREGFDGLEVAWTKQEPKHKQALLKICSLLRDAFQKEATISASKRLLLTIAVLSKGVTDRELYEPAQLQHYVDRITVLAFNFHGDAPVRLMHHSPLYKRDKAWDTLSQREAMAWWADKCVVRDKLILGLAAFGRSYNVGTRRNFKKGGNSEPGKSVSSTPGNAGPFTGKPGVLAYYEICHIMSENNWKTIYDRIWKAAYAYGNRDRHYEWVSFDNQVSLSVKCNFVKREGYGGIMIWSLGTDDFDGRFCRQGKYPLLQEAARIFPKTRKESVRTSEVDQTDPSAWTPFLQGFAFGFIGIIIGGFGSRIIEKIRSSILE